jgi:hypothetical protein
MYMLSERTLTLLDPKSWDDQNDAYYLALYKEKKGLKSLLAVCFTQSSETYHHWRVFASGSSGVCVRFVRSDLLSAVKRQPGIRARDLTYLTLSEIRNRQLRTRDLPFLKRFAFEHEDEFRLVYESGSERCSKLDIRVPLSCIDRITLSPWLHPSLASHVKRTIHAIKGCGALEIVRSTLIGNVEWQKLGDAAA